MDALDLNIVQRVMLLEQQVGDLAEQLRLANQYVRTDPGSSLTKSRLVMEKLLLEIYRKVMNREPRKPLLGDMLADNQFTRKIERRIVARIEAIREMGNLGPHGEPAQPADALRVLDDLCTVLDWYVPRYSRQAGPTAADPATVSLSSGPNSAQRSRGVWPRPVVWLGVVMVITAACLSIFWRLRVAGERTAIPPGDAAGPLADVFHIEWFEPDEEAFHGLTGSRGGQSKQERLHDVSKKGRWVQLDSGQPARGTAEIIQPDYSAIQDLSRSNVCALRFELQPSHGVPWLRLDEVRVIVHDYLPPPLVRKRVDVLTKMGAEKVHLFYVEIDDTATAGQGTFAARLCSEKGIGDPLQIVRLDVAKPEGFALRINARLPGTYTFSVTLSLSYRDRKMTHNLAERAAYYFFEREK